MSKKSNKRANKPAHKPVIETLEPRLLLSATPLPQPRRWTRTCACPSPARPSATT